MSVKSYATERMTTCWLPVQVSVDSGEIVNDPVVCPLRTGNVPLWQTGRAPEALMLREFMRSEAAGPSVSRQLEAIACDDGKVAYDEGIATRVREVTGAEPGLTEKAMFGGLAILLNGNMAVGVHGDALIVRVRPDEHEQLLDEPGARPFDMTGRPMKGWLLVDADAISEDEDLRRWVDRGVTFARSLPSK